MTTKITIEPAGHFLLLSSSKRAKSPAGLTSYSYEENIIPTQEFSAAPITTYIHGGIEISVREIEEDDERVVEWKTENVLKRQGKGGTREDPLNQRGVEVDTKDTTQTQGLTDEFVDGLKTVRTKAGY